MGSEGKLGQSMQSGRERRASDLGSLRRHFCTGRPGAI